MLTIKHLGPGLKYTETLRAVEYVTFDPNSGSNDSDGCVYGTDHDGLMHSFLGGVVYVMNDAGATVGKYDMNPPREPGVCGAR